MRADGAFVKEMQADGLEWGELARSAAMTEIIQDRMTRRSTTARQTAAPCATGATASMRDLSELGGLSVPRTRRCPTGVLKSYARRAPEIDRTILAGFAGLSTRKMGEVLLPLLGRPVSASTVSPSLDAVAAFHARLANRYKALMLDGVVLKTGAGALKRPVLVALGIHADERRSSTSVAQRSAAMGTLPHRSLPPRAHRGSSRSAPSAARA